MKVGLVSKIFKNNDIEFNKNQIIKTANDYKDENIDFLCFGEAFLQGFDSFSWNYENDKKVALSKNSTIINDLKSAAKSNHIGLAFGYLENDESVFFSSYIFIDDQGKLIYNYRRYSSGWREDHVDINVYQEGKEIGVFEYKNKKIAIGLCGDFWDDRYDYLKLISEIEKDFVIWPVYVNFSLLDWEKELPEYAKQSLLFSQKVLMINSISLNPRSYGGCFVFQRGKIVRKICFDIENVLIVNIH